GESLSLWVVGECRTATNDFEQLPNLMLPDVNDVTVDLIRGTATRHQFHEGAPPFGDGCETGKGRCRTQGPAFRFELFNRPQDLGFFGGRRLHRAGRITG